jgi:hypothetical protein
VERQQNGKAEGTRTEGLEEDRGRLRQRPGWLTAREGAAGRRGGKGGNAVGTAAVSHGSSRRGPSPLTLLTNPQPSSDALTSLDHMHRREWLRR